MPWERSPAHRGQTPREWRVRPQASTCRSEAPWSCRGRALVTSCKELALLCMCIVQLKQAGQPCAAGLHCRSTTHPRTTHLEGESGVLLLQAPLEGPPTGRVVEGDGAALAAVQPDVLVIACRGINPQQGNSTQRCQQAQCTAYCAATPQILSALGAVQPDVLVVACSG